MQELFVVSPDTTQADEALQPNNGFVLILRGGQQHRDAQKNMILLAWSILRTYFYTNNCTLLKELK